MMNRRFLLFTFFAIVSLSTLYAQPNIALKKLKSNIKEVNKVYPMQSSLGCWIVKEFIEGESLVILTEVDGRLTSFSKMKLNSEKMKKSFLGMHATNQHLISKTKMVTDCGLQIVYRYVNKQNKDHFDVVLTHVELNSREVELGGNHVGEDVIKDIIEANIKKLNAAMTFLMSIEEPQSGKYFQTAEEAESYHNYRKNKMRFEEFYDLFMCNDEDDKTTIRNSVGEKISLLPTITMTLKNMQTGETLLVKKSIRNLNSFFEKTKYSVERIDIESVRVFLIDRVKKMESNDKIGHYVYYDEHVYSIANYCFDGGTFKQNNLKKENFNIERGKSYWGVHRDEESLLRNDNVVVLFGDVSLIIYHK